MRRTIIILSALALSSGVAVADRSHGGGGHVSQASHGGGGHVSQVSHGGGGHVAAAARGSYGGGHVYGGGGRVYNGGGHVYGGGRVYGGGTRVVGRGDYRVWNGGRWDRNYYRGYYYDGGYYRPWAGVHYYDYYHRPAIIVENFSPMAGYYWVPGAWQWDGNEWNWYPGHYEPSADYGY